MCVCVCVCVCVRLFGLTPHPIRVVVPDVHVAGSELHGVNDSPKKDISLVVERVCRVYLSVCVCVCVCGLTHGSASPVCGL